MKCDKLFSTIDSLSEEYIQFLIDICNIDSQSIDKDGVDKVGKYITERAITHGWKIEVSPQPVSGDAICITMNDGAKGAPICFSGHMDTVHPKGLFGTSRDEEKIYGPGVLDCKGGIASAFMAMDALERCGFTSRPVKLILQSDEEISSRNNDKATVKFMAKCAEGAVAFLNGEPYVPGSLVIMRKGILKFAFEITGESTHASLCYRGKSAIAEAAHKIIELEKLKDVWGITCNCGMINGGTAENTVPETCTFTADIRFATKEQMEEAKRLAKQIAEHSYIEGTRCTLTLKSLRTNMEKAQRNYELLDKINEAYRQSGLPVLEPNSSFGGSDAADMTAAGIPCLDCFGTEGGGIHSRDEFIYTRSIAESAKRYAAVAYLI